jgi:hypothetical protein
MLASTDCTIEAIDAQCAAGGGSSEMACSSWLSMMRSQMPPGTPDLCDVRGTQSDEEFAEMWRGTDCTVEFLDEQCGGPLDSETCAGFLNRMVNMSASMPPPEGAESAPSADSIRAGMCSEPPPPAELPPACPSVADVAAACGGCSNTILAACSEPFSDSPPDGGNAKSISLCPLIAVPALMRLW